MPFNFFSKKLMRISNKFLSVIEEALDEASSLVSGNPQERAKLILETCFGEAMFSQKFTMREAIKWLNAHEKLIKAGATGLVILMDDQRFQEIFAKKFKAALDEEDYYLVLTIVGKEAPDPENSLLVNFEELDEQLQTQLENGDGYFTVGD